LFAAFVNSTLPPLVRTPPGPPVTPAADGLPPPVPNGTHPSATATGLVGVAVPVAGVTVTPNVARPDRPFTRVSVEPSPAAGSADATVPGSMAGVPETLLTAMASTGFGIPLLDSPPAPAACPTRSTPRC